MSLVGIAFALVAVGGALGKAVFGRIGERFGVTRSVILTEAGTALAILAVVLLPLDPVLVVLPLLGLMLNGTSSVLYGTVPELAPGGRVERAFAIFTPGPWAAARSRRRCSTAPGRRRGPGLGGDGLGRHGRRGRAPDARPVAPPRSTLDPGDVDAMTHRTGRCHCGAVQFEVTLVDGFSTIRRCTCSYCRMRGAVVASAEMADIRIVQGEEALTRYRFNTGTAAHFFCSRCCGSTPTISAARTQSSTV